MAELIVDFPTHRDRRSMRSVQFADTPEMYIVDRHDDNKDVDRHDLWYNELDYSRMKLATEKSVLKTRAMASAGVPISDSGDDGTSDDCLIGIEHRLTRACALKVMVCRRRCVRAVLQEQARQMMNPSTTFKAWVDIAAASFVVTRKAAIRAEKLGKLHRDSI
jgi:hypothetical protein